MNKVCLIGRLTANPELKKTDAVTMCVFTLAIHESKEQVSFIPVTAFGSLAETIATYTHKGDMVAVEGSLKQRSYSTAEGSKRNAINVVCSGLDFLSKKPEEAKEEPKTSKKSKSAQA